VLPVVSWRTAAAGAILGISTLAAYRAVLVTSWTLALLGGAVLWWDGSLRPGQIGLQGLPPGVGLAWTGATLSALLAGAAGVSFLRRRLGRPESRHLLHLLPRSPVERRMFPAVALTAGLTEEFIYRGIALTALAGTPLLAGNAGRWWAAALVAVAFGLGHGYQDALGMLRASILGMALAVPCLLSGSLLPSMVAHAAVDLSLLWPVGRRLAGDAG
jgi:membrane protease YdiL (CAAX protease family)